MNDNVRRLAPDEQRVTCGKPAHQFDKTHQPSTPSGFARLADGSFSPVSVQLRPPAYQPLPYLVYDLLEALDTAVTGGYDVRLVREPTSAAYQVHIASKHTGTMSMTILIFRNGSRRGQVKKVTVHHPPTQVRLPDGTMSHLGARSPESLTGHPSAVAAIRAALHQYPVAEPHVITVPRGHVYHPQRGVTVPLSHPLVTQKDLCNLPGIHDEVVHPLTRLQSLGMMIRLLQPEALNRPNAGTYEVEVLHNDGLLWGGWWLRFGVSRKNGRITEIHARSAHEMRQEWKTFTPERRQKLVAAEHSPSLVFGHEFREGRGYRKGPVQALTLLNDVIGFIETDCDDWTALTFFFSQTTRSHDRTATTHDQLQRR